MAVVENQHAQTGVFSITKKAFRQAFKNIYSWVKENPVLTFAILAGLIAAGVFTGGTILIPAMFAVVTSIEVGGVVSIIAGVIIGGLAGVAVGGSSFGGEPGGESGGGLLGAVLGGLGIGFAVIVGSPIVAAAIFGLVITAVSTGIGAALGGWFNSCFRRQNTAPNASRDTQQNENAQRSRQELSSTARMNNNGILVSTNKNTQNDGNIVHVDINLFDQSKEEKQVPSEEKRDDLRVTIKLS